MSCGNLGWAKWEGLSFPPPPLPSMPERSLKTKGNRIGMGEGTKLGYEVM